MVFLGTTQARIVDAVVLPNLQSLGEACLVIIADTNRYY